MAILNDLTGQRFNKLLVIGRAENSKNGTSRWICKCDCGKTTIVTCTKLTRGNTKSCGCWRKRRNGESRTRLYNIWNNMHKRCENPNHGHYTRYGGRGICICEDWRHYENFKEWALSSGYKDNLSIDRINVNGNYEPNNCRWVTQKEQMNNIATNKMIIYDGKSYTASQFADFLHVPRYTIRNQMRLGWSPEKMAERALM